MRLKIKGLAIYVILLLLLVNSFTFSQQGKSAGTSETAANLWVSAYYDVWQMIPMGSAWWAEPPDRIDYTNGITHIIQFPNGNIRTNNPFFGPVGGVNSDDSLDTAYGTGRPSNPPRYRDSLIAKAHRNGVRVLLCINAVCANNLVAVLDQNGNGIIDGRDSSRCDTLTASVAAYLSRHGYDGVDINIEHGCAAYPSIQHIGILLRRMRHYLDLRSAGIGGRMVITLSPTSGAEGGYPVAVCNATVDQINPQTYDNQYAWSGCVGANVNWYANALYPPSALQLGANAGCFGAGNLAHSISGHGPARWAAAGYNKSILGVGISTYGRLRTPNRTAFEAFTGDGYAANQQGIINGLLSNGGTMQPYDTVTKTQAITGTALQSATYNGTVARVTAGQGFYYTYPTARSVQDDIEWIKANGYSGIMLFDYQMDCDAANADVTKRNPIIHAAGQASGGGALLPPATPQNQTPVNGANAQPTTGVQFTWNAPFGASSYHFQIATSSSFTIVLAEFDLAGNSTTVGVSPFVVGLVAPLTYYWRVSATGAGGTSGYSTPSSFSTVANAGTPPQSPVLVSPANGGSESMNSIDLTIQTDPQDTIFANIFQVKTDTLSGTFIMDDSSALSSSKTVSNLVPGTSYFWRAASKNNSGRSPFTGWWSFTVTSDLWLYRDTLLSPWADASWGTSPNFTSTENVYEGTHAIRTVLGAWGGLQFDGSAPGASASQISATYTTLQFMAYVSSAGLNLNVFLQNASGNSFPHIVYSNVPVNRWVSLSFPLSQLNPNDYPYDQVAIQNFTGSSYTVFVDQIRLGGQQTSGVTENGVPSAYALEQNFPNPFNPETRIQYELPVDSRVRLRVYNILGQEVATLVDATELAGIHTASWNSSNGLDRPAPSGVYFYRLDAVGTLEPQYASTLIRKMTLLK